MKIIDVMKAIVSSATLSASLAATMAFAGPTATPVKNALPADAPPPAGQTAADVAAWRSSYVNETDMLPLGATQAGVEYAVKGSFAIAGPGLVRGWMRWEGFTSTPVETTQARSTEQLIEVDCQNGRGRLMAMDVYPHNNLQGPVQHIDDQDPQWSYARPGSVLEQNISFMCTAARTVVAAAAQAQGDGAQGPQQLPESGAVVASNQPGLGGAPGVQ